MENHVTSVNLNLKRHFIFLIFLLEKDFYQKEECAPSQPPLAFIFACASSPSFSLVDISLLQASVSTVKSSGPGPGPIKHYTSEPLMNNSETKEPPMSRDSSLCH